ncbi:hypothetical protein V8C42DRAFT_115404 [Trichoderma barbatum]
MMPRMGLMAVKKRDGSVPFGSLVHNDAVIYVSTGNTYIKYYIIVAVIVSITISLLSLSFDLRSRLKDGLPPRAHHRFLFGRMIRKHEQKVAAAAAAQESSPPDTYNMTNVAPGPVTNLDWYPAYPGHADGGEKFDSAQEPTKEATETNILPAYEPPSGPSPPAVTR